MRALAVGAAAFAAFVIPGERLGVNAAIVALLAATAVATYTRPSFDAIAFGVLAVALASMSAVLDATWVLVVDLAVAVVLGACAVTGPRIVALSAPVQALRDAPALVPPAPIDAAPALRGIGLGAALLIPFAALFWTADAAFAEIGRQTPVPSVALLPQRVLLFGVVLALTVGLALATRRTSTSRSFGRSRLSPSEWAIPLILLDLLFLAFVAVQITVLFGGRDHVLETAGLTYAEYARQGFWQLIAVAALTLVVVGASTRLADTGSQGRERLLKALLGALCVLTIVTVASALHRLGLYQEAFGLTRLRLAAETFTWGLGALFAVLLLAGTVPAVRAQLARIVLVGVGAGLIAFSLSNPDGRIAERNIDRWRATGHLDVEYLQRLSADAAPALVDLPEPLRTEVIAPMSQRLDRADSWSSANVSRHRARQALAESD